MPTDANGYETITPDDICASGIRILFVALTLESARIVSAPKDADPVHALKDTSHSKDIGRLIELVLRRACGGGRAADDEDLGRATKRVLDGVNQLLGSQPGRAARDKLVRLGAPHAVEALSLSMDRYATEELGASVRLVQTEEAFVLLWKSLTREGAQLGVLAQVYALLDRQARHIPLVAIERTACRWWFERLRDPAAASQEPHAARRIREREWSLADRKSFATNATVLEAACAMSFETSLSPGARRMVSAARKSRLGVFVVRASDGAEASIEDAAVHERLRLCEHEPERPCAAGAVIVGRLYPTGNGRYLRSPGAFVLDPAAMAPAAKILEFAGLLVRRRFPLALALEIVVAEVNNRAQLGLPREVPAADSRAAARRILDDLRATMEDLGMFEHPKSKHALWLEPGDKGASWTIFGWEADMPLAAWVENLLTIAGIAHQVRR
jgi:hypothetical protein